MSAATVVVRVPADAFAGFVGRMRELGEVRGEATSATDVSEQYMDTAARLASARVLEKRLLELAADKTATVDAVLAVERELARVRGEIESHEAHIRQWDSQVAMSTLTLELTTNAPAIAATERGLGERIASGFDDSVAALRALGGGLAVAVVALLPWLLFAIPGALIARRVLRRRSKLPVATTR